jgi:hypothetical protein
MRRIGERLQADGLGGVARSCFLAAALWNAYHLDGAALTRRQVLLAEKSAIGTVQSRSIAESCFMTAQRVLDMVLVRGIPVEHFILGDQTVSRRLTYRNSQAQPPSDQASPNLTMVGRSWPVHARRVNFSEQLKVSSSGVA